MDNVTVEQVLNWTTTNDHIFGDFYLLGVCNCDIGFKGLNCSDIECPTNCGPHGNCDYKTGKCVCKKDCHGAGTCDSQYGHCICDLGYYGNACECKLIVTESW